MLSLHCREIGIVTFHDEKIVVFCTECLHSKYGSILWGHTCWFIHSVCSTNIYWMTTVCWASGLWSYSCEQNRHNLCPKELVFLWTFPGTFYIYIHLQVLPGQAEGNKLLFCHLEHYLLKHRRSEVLYFIILKKTMYISEHLVRYATCTM